MWRSRVLRMGVPPNVKSVQDMPPSGGYPSIKFVRGCPPRGPPGWAIWGGIAAATIYGFIQIGNTNAERRYCNKEKRDARMAILPFLMAEQDRSIQAKITEATKREEAVMHGVEGWKVGENVYSSRWQAPRN